MTNLCLASLPARVQKCGVMLERALVFRLAVSGGVHYTYFAPGDGLRACACGRQSPHLDYPHAVWLGAHLAAIEDADLVSIEQLADEDVIRLVFSSGVTLWLHFFGQSGNAVLTAHDNTILAAWHLLAHHRPGTLYQRTPSVLHDSVINVMQPDALITQLSSLACEDLRRSLSHHLQAQREKLMRRLEKIDADANYAGRADQFRQHGELLRAYYHLLQPHSSNVQIQDFEHPDANLTIPLDPHKSPQENVRWYFHQAEKCRRAPAAITRRRHETMQALAALDQRAAALDAADSLSALQAMLPRAVPSVRTPHKDPSLARFRRLRSSDGLLIIAGRSARDNDELTCHVARGHDVWMHTRNRPGAHVIIRSNRGQPVPHTTLREAALVCTHLSKVPDGEVEEILYTLRKHVTKPKGAKPGLVLVAGGKTLTVKERKAAMEEWLRTHPWDTPAQ